MADLSKITIPVKNQSTGSISNQEFNLKTNATQESGSLSTNHTVGRYSYLIKRGNMVTFSFLLTLTSDVARWGNIGILPEGFRPIDGKVTYFLARLGSTVGLLTIDGNGLFKSDQYDLTSGSTVCGSVTYICKD